MTSPIKLNSQNKSKQSQANFNLPLEVDQTRKILAVNSGDTGIEKTDQIMATRGTTDEISSHDQASLTSFERNQTLKSNDTMNIMAFQTGSLRDRILNSNDNSLKYLTPASDINQKLTSEQRTLVSLKATPHVNHLQLDSQVRADRLSKLQKLLSPSVMGIQTVTASKESFSKNKIQDNEAVQEESDQTCYLEKEALDLEIDERDLQRQRYASQQKLKQLETFSKSCLHAPTQGQIRSSSNKILRLSKEQMAPQMARINLRALQNLRLNEMRQQMKHKIGSKSRITESELSLSSIESDREKPSQSSQSLPPIKQIPSTCRNKKAHSSIREFNVPDSFVRPIGQVIAPIMTDHVGSPPTPKQNKKTGFLGNRQSDITLNMQQSFGHGHQSSQQLSGIMKNQGESRNQLPQKTVLERQTSKLNLGLPELVKTASVKSTVTRAKEVETPAVTKVIRKQSKMFHKKGKNLKKKVTIQRDEYGARLNANQEEQVHAIVMHFRQRMRDGTYQILAGPPKKRDPFPKIAMNSEILLQDVIEEYQSRMLVLAQQKANERAKEKSQIFLGSFNEQTLEMYEEIENLKLILSNTRLKQIQQQNENFGGLNDEQASPRTMQKQDNSLQEIGQKIQTVYDKLVATGPKVPQKLKSFVSIEHTLTNDFPTHLPDVQKETSKIFEEINNPSWMMSQSSWRQTGNFSQKSQKSSQEFKMTKADVTAQKFFKPFDNAQLVAFPDQACIKDNKLEVFRYDLGNGLVDSLSQVIADERRKEKAINELTLDQNNLSDAQLAKILGALLIQGEKFQQSCQTINISNNEFGHLTALALRRFFDFPSPENISSLRLSNLHITDSNMSDLFQCLRLNRNLLKLRLSGVTLSQNRAIDALVDFLSYNEQLTDLDLSHTSLQVGQMIQIFAALPTTISLSYLNIAFNTIEYVRAPEPANELFQLMSNFFQTNEKLVHLDLSGCNFGEKIVEIGPAIAKSLTIQSVHLHQNEIPEHARQTLFDQFRIRAGARQTRVQIQQEIESKCNQYEEDGNAWRLIANSAKQNQGVQLDQQMEEKMAQLKRQQLKMECIQFHGVGRRREAYDKLILMRYIGHQELNLFSKYNVISWQVSPTDQCYICEKWRYTVYFYERKKHIKNKLFDCVTRWILTRLNHHMNVDYRRRVSPTITSPTLISHTGTLKMCNLLEFASRINPRICQILEQTQVNVAVKGNNMQQMIKFYLQNKVIVADNITLCMDLDLNEYISKNLRYQEDSEVINLPDEAEYFSREMEDDNTFIWAGFAKPGKHTVVIKDPLDLSKQPVQETFLIGVREQDLIKSQAPQIEDADSIKEQGASRLDTNILFGNWKKDSSTGGIYDICFNFDLAQIQLQGLYKSEMEIFEIHQIIKNNYQSFIKTHAVLSAHSSSYPLVDKPRWELLCQLLQLFNSSFEISDCFRVYHKCCNGFGLSRPGFLKAIIVLIKEKYLRPEAQSHMKRMITRISSRQFATVVKMPQEYLINDMVRGVRHFFENLLGKFSAKRTWQEFRGAYVQKVKVSQILISHMTILRRVYSNWSEIILNKRFLSQHRSLQLIKSIINVTKKHSMGRPMVITDSAITTSWGLSKLIVKDTQRDFARTEHMVFVEFLEFICRIAHEAYFSEPKEVIKMYKPNKKDEQAKEEEEKEFEFVFPEESEGSDREERKEEEKKKSGKGSDDSDEEFVPSDRHADLLNNFKFCFGKRSFQQKGKKFRRKLKAILLLLPQVQNSSPQRQ